MNLGLSDRLGVRTQHKENKINIVLRKIKEITYNFGIFTTLSQLLNSKRMLNIIHGHSIDHCNTVIFPAKTIQKVLMFVLLENQHLISHCSADQCTLTRGWGVARD